MEYKGYKAKITYSDEDEVFFGKILGICDLVTFEAESVSDLKNEFKLKKLEEFSDLNGLYFKDLDKSIQRTIKNAEY